MLRFPPRTRRGSIGGGTVGLALFLLIGFVVGVFACNDSTTTTLVPTTGILIRAEQLTAGRGCGTGPTEIYKYAVVVFQYGGSGDPAQRSNYTLPYTSNVFDCYVDGEFVSLAAVGTNETYRFEVYAYNADAFNATPQIISAAGTKTSDLKNLTKPTYTTQCTATQSDQVEQLALCDPLSARPRRRRRRSGRRFPDANHARDAVVPPARRHHRGLRSGRAIRRRRHRRGRRCRCRRRRLGADAEAGIADASGRRRRIGRRVGGCRRAGGRGAVAGAVREGPRSCADRRERRRAAGRHRMPDDVRGERRSAPADLHRGCRAHRRRGQPDRPNRLHGDDANGVPNPVACP